MTLLSQVRSHCLPQELRPGEPQFGAHLVQLCKLVEWHDEADIAASGVGVEVHVSSHRVLLLETKKAAADATALGGRIGPHLRRGQCSINSDVKIR